MERRRLAEAEIDKALAELQHWNIKEEKLYRQFKFETFAQAIGWMVAVAIHADKMDHHPEWSNVYNRVEVSLVTHDLNAISTLDLQLARQMESLFANS